MKGSNVGKNQPVRGQTNHQYKGSETGKSLEGLGFDVQETERKLRHGR